MYCIGIHPKENGSNSLNSYGVEGEDDSEFGAVAEELAITKSDLITCSVLHFSKDCI